MVEPLSPARVGRPLWFGRVLRWTRHQGTHTALYLGREHVIEKVGRERAQAIGGGCSPGWHLAVHPDAWDIDPAERNLIGPSLGGTVKQARVMAEVWILTSESDRRHAEGSVNLELALRGLGAGFSAGSGRTLVAYPDHRRHLVEICHESPWNAPRTGALVGTIQGSITAAHDGPVSFTWTSQAADGTALGLFSTWHFACRAVGDTA